MGLVQDASGRLNIETPLIAESLMDRALLLRTETEAIFRPLPGPAVERSMLNALVAARGVQEVLLVNGREQGLLTRALAGENVGMRIYRA